MSLSTDIDASPFSSAGISPSGGTDTSPSTVTGMSLSAGAGAFLFVSAGISLFAGISASSSTNIGISLSIYTGASLSDNTTSSSLFVDAAVIFLSTRNTFAVLFPSAFSYIPWSVSVDLRFLFSFVYLPNFFVYAITTKI